MAPETNQPEGNAAPQVPSPIPPQAPSPAAPPLGANSQLKQIRTYQGDVAEALTQQHESLYSIQAKEHARNGGSTAQAVKSVWPLLVGSFLLLAFAGIGSYLAYGEYVRKTTPPAPSVPESRLLSAESTKEVDIRGLERNRIIPAIFEASGEAKAGELRHILLKAGTSTVSASAFLAALDTEAPASLERALDPIFMLGTLGESRFIIFKLASYPNAFGGMLNWEKTLPSDLGPLFNTFDSLKPIAPASVFKDVVYRNKDVRALYAEATSTSPVLLYSFFDNRLLIVTDRLETLQTLIDRLTREALAR